MELDWLKNLAKSYRSHPKAAEPKTEIIDSPTPIIPTLIVQNLYEAFLQIALRFNNLTQGNIVDLIPYTNGDSSVLLSSKGIQLQIDCVESKIKANLIQTLGYTFASRPLMTCIHAQDALGRELWRDSSGQFYSLDQLSEQLFIELVKESKKNK